jgi:hypothetical protein
LVAVVRDFHLNITGFHVCMARTLEGAALFGVEEKKLAAVWEYQSNSL